VRIESLNSYHASLREALEDGWLRGALDRFCRDYARARAEAFAGMDPEALIRAVAELKDKAIADGPALLSRFSREAEKRGARVALAATAAEARGMIVSIARENAVKNVTTSKSMTGEEIGLTEALEGAGVRVTETDLGERIVQLRGEAPSHMVLPAIHLSRRQVAETFAEAFGSPQEPDVLKLVRAARASLRGEFARADMGVTGANFLIAESGSAGVLSNEGNAGLVMSLPKIHVVLAGTDKLVPSLSDALKIMRVLPRSATGQSATSRASFVSGAAERPGGGRQQLHIVLLDGGRSRIAADPAFREVLRCVRCGACANVCPVYRLVGGQRMSWTYIGALGLVLTLFFSGPDAARHLSQNCAACGACREVCAAGIDLPGLIFEVRARLRAESGAGPASALLSALLPRRRLLGAAVSALRAAQSPLSGESMIRHPPLLFARERGFRALPRMAARTFRELFPQIGPRAAPEAQGAAKPAVRAAVFSGCAHEYVFPEELASGVRVMRALGAAVSLPGGQGCCGLPALALGDKKAAARCAEANVLAFRGWGGTVVTLCPSCASFVRTRYPALLAGRGDLAEPLQRLCSSITDFSSLLLGPLGASPESFQMSGETAALHIPCHLRLGLHAGGGPRRLIEMAAGYRETPDEELCCGFGGSFSFKFPEESAALLARKLKGYESAGVSAVVTDCPGCAAQLRGGEEKRGRLLRIEHTASFLERRLKAK
jgi:iron-sulfur cluster protein